MGLPDATHFRALGRFRKVKNMPITENRVMHDQQSRLKIDLTARGANEQSSFESNRMLNGLQLFFTGHAPCHRQKPCPLP
jgi:hypothetical protein